MSTIQERVFPLLVILFVISGCASMSPAEKRKQLDTMAGNTITRLLKQFPELGTELEKVPGYFVAHINAPATEGGEGVLVANSTNEYIYYTVERVETDSSWGQRPFKILLLIKTQTVLDSFRADRPAPATGKNATGNTATPGSNKYAVYIMSDIGIAVTASVRISGIRINRELANTQSSL